MLSDANARLYDLTCKADKHSVYLRICQTFYSRRGVYCLNGGAAAVLRLYGNLNEIVLAIGSTTLSPIYPPITAAELDTQTVDSGGVLNGNA